MIERRTGVTQLWAGLYGSVARGNDEAGSELDLALVTASESASHRIGVSPNSRSTVRASVATLRRDDFTHRAVATRAPSITTHRDPLGSRSWPMGVAWLEPSTLNGW